MTKQDIERLTDAWFEYWNTGGPRRKLSDERYDWIDDVLDRDPEIMWEFIQTAYNREMSDSLFAVLAAGPLEDLLSEHGLEFIDRVEIEARQNPRFRELLGGVWRSNITDDVWQRIGKYRGPTW